MLAGNGVISWTAALPVSCSENVDLDSNRIASPRYARTRTPDMRPSIVIIPGWNPRCGSSTPPSGCAEGTEPIYPVLRMRALCWWGYAAAEDTKTAKINARDIMVFYARNRHISISISLDARGPLRDMESGRIAKRELLPLDIVDLEGRLNVAARTGTLCNAAGSTIDAL